MNLVASTGREGGVMRRHILLMHISLSLSLTHTHTHTHAQSREGKNVYSTI
jgi:hypothetical protein